MSPGSDGCVGWGMANNKRGEHISFRNRILSICLDSEYVSDIARSIPGCSIIANERCGSWYVSPAIKDGSAYFKSTDGHTGSWSFNTRRLNLGLLDILSKHGRCLLVDSARRRAMPDALSKTVPIWVAVMNRLLFPEREDSHSLSTDERHVSNSEHVQIESHLENFFEVAKSLPLDIDVLRQTVNLPIKVHFCSNRDNAESMCGLDSRRFVHLICMCASMHGLETTTIEEGFNYISGAGDDPENWARGLTPDLMWENIDRISLCTDGEEAAKITDEIVRLSGNASPISTGAGSTPQPIYLTPSAPAFFVGTCSAVEAVRIGSISADAVIVCQEAKDSTSDASYCTDLTEDSVRPTSIDRPCNGKLPVLRLHCPARKLGSRALRTEFHRVGPFLRMLLDTNSKPQLLFASTTGIDLAIGAALATVCLHMDSDGQFQAQGKRLQARSNGEGKSFVRRRLVQILEQTGLDDHGASSGKGLQRTTLNAVNSLVIERPGGSTTDIKT